MSLAATYPTPVAYRAAIQPVHSVVTPNTTLIVSADEAKVHLGYPAEDSDKNVELSAFIATAQEAIEHYCNLSLLPTVWRADLPVLAEAQELRKRPYSSFTSVEYVNAANGEVTTLDVANYHVAAAPQERAVLYLGQGLAWPAAANRADAYRITYTAGWADPSMVPMTLKQAVLATVANMDSNRGDCDSGGSTVYEMKQMVGVIPKMVRNMLAPYKLVEVYVA